MERQNRILRGFALFCLLMVVVIGHWGLKIAYGGQEPQEPRSPVAEPTLAALQTFQASPEPAQGYCSALELEDGRPIILSTWPAGADRVCFFQPGLPDSERCTDTPLETMLRSGAHLLTIEGSEFALSGDCSGVELPPGTPMRIAAAVLEPAAQVEQVWEAQAASAAGRSPSSSAQLRLAPTQPPDAPELLGVLQELAEAQVRAWADVLRQVAQARGDALRRPPRVP